MDLFTLIQPSPPPEAERLPQIKYRLDEMWNSVADHLIIYKCHSQVNTIKSMNAILIAFHCKSNIGYAMNSLLPVFIEMAKRLVNSEANIHASFTELNGSSCDITPNYCKNYIEFDPSTKKIRTPGN